MGKNKNKGDVVYQLTRIKFSCGHTAYTDPNSKECPKCKKVD